MNNIEQYAVITAMVIGIIQSVKGILPGKMTELIPLCSWVLGGVLAGIAASIGVIQESMQVAIFSGICASFASNALHSQLKHIKKKPV